MYIKYKEKLNMIARLIDCGDHDCQYGILTVKNASLKEVQDKIFEIKNKFDEEGFEDWCLDDVFEKFPEEWEWDFTQTDYDDTIEI